MDGESILTSIAGNGFVNFHLEKIYEFDFGDFLIIANKIEFIYTNEQQKQWDRVAEVILSHPFYQ